MKAITLDKKYHAMVKAIEKYNKENGWDDFHIGISSYGLLQEVTEAIGIKDNTGGNLRYIAHRVANVMREMIKAGYPITESKILCCSWTSKETWHPLFEINVN